MIEKLTMNFFRRYPDLASAMVGWNFLDCMNMLVIALIPITLKNDGIRWSLLIECLIVIFLFYFEKSLKKIVVVSLEPRSLRLLFREEIRETNQRGLEIIKKYVPIISVCIKVFYWISIFLSTSLEETVKLTICTLLLVKWYFLAYTEAMKLIEETH